MVEEVPYNFTNGTIYLRFDSRTEWNTNWMRFPIMDALCTYYIYDVIHSTIWQFLRQSVYGKGTTTIFVLFKINFKTI